MVCDLAGDRQLCGGMEARSDCGVKAREASWWLSTANALWARRGGRSEVRGSSPQSNNFFSGDGRDSAGIGEGVGGRICILAQALDVFHEASSVSNCSPVAPSL